MNFNYDIVRESFGEDAVLAAKELNSMYTEEMYKWMASMWDGETGAFYYSTSAKDNDEFFPDSESTLQCIGLLHTLGLTTDEIESISSIPVTDLITASMLISESTYIAPIILSKRSSITEGSSAIPSLASPSPILRYF